MKSPSNPVALVEETVEEVSSSNSVHQTQKIVEYMSRGCS